MTDVRRGRPRTAALRLKSFRVLGMVPLFDGGRPRTAALRLKSFRVLGEGASDRRGAGAGGDRREFFCGVGGGGLGWGGAAETYGEVLIFVLFTICPAAPPVDQK